MKRPVNPNGDAKEELVDLGDYTAQIYMNLLLI